MDKNLIGPVSAMLLLGLGLSGCSSAQKSAPEGSTGEINIQLTNVPADAGCLRVTVQGSRSSTGLFDLTPGSAASFKMARLPVGVATVTGDAFAAKCANIAGSEPIFVTEAPVSVRIDPSDVANVLLKLIRNGRLSIGVDFEKSSSPYLLPTATGVITKDLLTTGDSVGGYRMGGIPDGLGQFDNGDGTFTLLMNHELTSAVGIPRAHGAKGAFVSKWTIRKSDLTIIKGEDLIKNVVLWDGSVPGYKSATTPATFSRFCSADLPPLSAFWDTASVTGFNGRLFMNGEEIGAEGRAFAHAMDGTSWELPRLGKTSWENSLAAPATGLKTVVVGLDDSTPGQVYVYIGTKTNTGAPHERAGLTNGSLFGVKVTGIASEDATTGIPSVTSFTLASLGNAENKTGAQNEADSIAAGVTTFNRPEDGAWDPSSPNDFYFVTTASFTGPSRLWRLRFTDVKNPERGGSVEMLLDGTEGQKMMDNITLDKFGHVYALEDVGSQDHLGRVLRYDIATDSLSFIAQHDAAKFSPGGAEFLTRDEEASGVIDASDILGQGWFLLDVQAHYATDAETVEGGQLLAMFDPESKACTTCDDNDPCTVDACKIGGGCLHTPISDGNLCQGGKLKVKILGFNDFHGQLSTGRKVSSRPVGGAAILASYLKTASKGIEDQTLIVHAGDHVGASPAASALLQDEPSISFLNTLANSACTYSDKLNASCNLVGTLGNHEFDEGKGELMRLLNGGNFPGGPFLEDPYQGARFPYVSANVVDELGGKPILPPYVIKKIKGTPVAFVGAVLKGTPTIVTPTGVAGLKFLDEADAANSYVPELKAQGVRAIVLLIHQGGSQTSYTGPTDATKAAPTGADILDIVKRLDSEFDVVVSGHSHSFTNALVSNNGGKQILLTQAFSASTAYDDIDLLIDPVTKDVVSKSAQIVTTWGDAGPGLTPDPVVASIVMAAESRVAPLVNRVIGFTPSAIDTTVNAAGPGESPMGDVIADAQRAATGTQFAFMNPGGIRAPLDAGDILWGELFTVQPFGNSLVTMKLTGAQIKQVLEQQWLGQPFPRIMQISGLTYTWDNALPVGSRIVEVRDTGSGLILDPVAFYTVTCNNFMAAGGDNFTTFVSGLNPTGGSLDLDALIEWVSHNNPLNPGPGGRITRLN